MNRSITFFLACMQPFLLAMALVACAGTTATTTDTLATLDIDIDGHPARVLVAVTHKEHITGLMFKESLPENEGMLFVYENAKVRCMWMKNTLIPLNAAFLDDTGRILAIADMAPGTLVPHCSPGPVRYVLEMNSGWFERNGLGKGSRVHLPKIPE